MTAEPAKASRNSLANTSREIPAAQVSSSARRKVRSRADARPVGPRVRLRLIDRNPKAADHVICEGQTMKEA